MKMNKFVIQFCKKTGPHLHSEFWYSNILGPHLLFLRIFFLGNDKNRGVSVFCFFNTNVFLELFLWNKKTRMRKTGGHLFLQCKIRAVSAICFYKDVI